MRLIKYLIKNYFTIRIILYMVCFSLCGQETDYKNLTASIKLSYPNSIEEFNPVFHFTPVNQDKTYICWSFSTLSFIESEMQRLGRDKIKLSVTYPVYFAFIEKARLYIQTKGKSRFSAGDLFGTVIDVIKKYGIVPDKNYTGKSAKQKTYDHTNLYKELYAYMENVKKNSIWNEKMVFTALKKIMNKYIGSPPEIISYKNKKYTPTEFAKKIVNLQWDDYIKITSFKNSPFYKYTSLNVPDNWVPDSSFFNVPLELFYTSLRNALKNNYSMVIDGDLTEPGRIGKADICFIPEYDIPSNAITQDAREYRFKEKITTDDHLMHIVGQKEIDGKDWFLVKDSWRDAFTGKHKGYFFFTHDFIKLKVLAYLIHKEAIPEIVNKL